MVTPLRAKNRQSNAVKSLVLMLILLSGASTASAQIYRWVDDKGKVTYSNATPPAGVRATVVDANGKAGAPSPESLECYTLRCQGERLERRQAQRDELETQARRRAHGGGAAKSRAASTSAATSRSIAA